MNYPSIGEYNQVIQKERGNCFRTLSKIDLIPSKKAPIKIYLFGSGAFAAVFKGSINGCTYAIRCFHSAENETIDRYKIICQYISQIDSSWKTDCDYLENEITVKGRSYPILKMEWINGILINEFVSINLHNNTVLSELQKKLVDISDDLEKNNIGHGDIQCGNIFISSNSSQFQVKLIDYDGMYVPGLSIKKSTEKGRSEFQHPYRTLDDFNPEMDRFSFWVIITALEAIKIDKILWQEVMQGGFNTLDNFLFTIQDFLNPTESPLFNRLYDLNSANLNLYLDKLKLFCSSEYSSITKPIILNQDYKEQAETCNKPHQNISTTRNTISIDRITSGNDFRIVANNDSAFILTSTFQKLGSTPLELNREIYEGKVILITNGKETKRITLNSDLKFLEVQFS